MKRRGFLTMDVTIAIVLAMLLLTLMTVAVIKQRAAEKRLSAARAAVRAVEIALLTLQTGGEVPEAATVETLQDRAPAGYRWVRITIPATDGSPAASLVGLVDAAAGRKGAVQ